MSKPDLECLTSAQKAAIDALVSVGHTALASAERMAALNLHAVREAMEDFAQGSQRMLQAKSPQAAAELQSELRRPQVEKGIAYSRSLHEISSMAQEDGLGLIEAQYHGFMQTMSELANQIAQSAPMGSADVAVAAIRSTMQAASEAFERFNGAVLRFTEVAENSVSTVSNAAVNVATGKTTQAKAAPAAAPMPAKAKAAPKQQTAKPVPAKPTIKPAGNVAAKKPAAKKAAPRK